MADSPTTPNVLLVDDDADLRSVFRMCLRNLDLRLVAAASGIEALEILEREPFELILLDVNMPGIDGFETARRAREMLGVRHVPIIFITAHDSSDEAVKRGYHLGALDFVRKPFDLEVLRAKVTAVLEVGRARAAAEAAARSLEQEVAARRRVEEQLLQSQKLEAVGRLAGGIAHDFNNQLFVIKGYTENLLSQIPEGSPLRRQVMEVHNAAERSAHLIRQLMAFSRKDAAEPRVVEVAAELSGCERLLSRLIGEDVDVRVTVEAGVGCVRIDPVQLEQVLMNLAINARDAMPAGGSLAIEVRALEITDPTVHGLSDAVPGPYVRIAVSDTGTGMDRKTRDRIFEPFFTTKETGRGTGLGLSTVYGIVNHAGGHIVVESEPGKGTTFRIYLPRSSEEIDGIGKPGEAAQSSAGCEVVMLVEDESQVRALVKMLLESHGYSVIEAACGPDALAAASDYSGRIDLLLTDLVMPQMNGRVLSERLLALHPETKVIFMSGYSEDVVGRRGVDSEGITLLQKPVTLQLLLAKVREALDAEP